MTIRNGRKYFIMKHFKVCQPVCQKHGRQPDHGTQLKKKGVEIYFKRKTLIQQKARYYGAFRHYNEAYGA